MDIPNLHWKTLKMVIDEFFNCLSAEEYQRLREYDDFFDAITNKQVDVDKFLLQQSIISLGKDLQLLKNDL